MMDPAPALEGVVRSIEVHIVERRLIVGRLHPPK